MRRPLTRVRLVKSFAKFSDFELCLCFLEDFIINSSKINVVVVKLCYHSKFCQ